MVRSNLNYNWRNEHPWFFAQQPPPEGAAMWRRIYRTGPGVGNTMRNRVPTTLQRAYRRRVAERTERYLRTRRALTYTSPRDEFGL